MPLMKGITCPNTFVMLNTSQRSVVKCNWVNVFRVSRTSTYNRSEVMFLIKIGCVLRTKRPFMSLCIYLSVHHQISTTHSSQIWIRLWWNLTLPSNFHVSNFGMISTLKFEITYMSKLWLSLKISHKQIRKNIIKIIKEKMWLKNQNNFLDASPRGPNFFDMKKIGISVTEKEWYSWNQINWKGLNCYMEWVSIFYFNVNIKTLLYQK